MKTLISLAIRDNANDIRDTLEQLVRPGDKLIVKDIDDPGPSNRVHLPPGKYKLKFDSSNNYYMVTEGLPATFQGRRLVIFPKGLEVQIEKWG